MDNPVDFVVGAAAIGLGIAAQGIPGVGTFVGAALFSFGAGKLASGIGLGPDAQKGIMLETRSTDAPLPVIYGETKVGGTLTELRADPATAGDEQFAGKVIAFAVGSENGAGIEDVLEVRLDQELAISSPEFARDQTSTGVVDFFDDKLDYSLHRGSDDQLSPIWLENRYGTSVWDESGRGRGIAMLGLAMEFDQEVFPGVPTAQLLVKGNRVYDPRDPTGGPDSDGFAFSNNPWLCLLDYLTSVRYGLDASYPDRDGPSTTGTVTADGPQGGNNTLDIATGAGSSIKLPIGGQFRIAGDPTIYTAETELDLGASSSGTVTMSPAFQQSVSGGEDISVIPFSEIDEQSFIDAANHADEIVPFTKDDGTTGTHKRHTFDSWLPTAANPDDHKANITRIVQSTGGMLVHQSGKWRAVPKRPTAAVDFELNESNILGDWSGSRSGIRDAPSRIRAEFTDASRSYQTNDVHWPQTNAANPFRDEDNNFPSTLSLQLPGVTSRARAQRMAQVALKEARADRTYQLRADESALQLQVGDVVPLKHPTPGYTTAEGFPEGKKFWVDAQQIHFEDERLQVGLTLREYDPDAYVTELGSPPEDSPDPVLPDPRPGPIDADLIGAWMLGFGAGGGDCDPPDDCTDICLCAPCDPRRRQHDFSGNGNNGSINKAVGFPWNDACPAIGPAGPSFRNGGGGFLVGVAGSLTDPTLQLTNPDGGSGFSAMGWFYSESVFNTTAQFGQRNDGAKEGWSANIDAQGSLASFNYYGPGGSGGDDGTAINIEDAFGRRVGQNEWVHFAVVVHPTDSNGDFHTDFFANGQWVGTKTMTNGPITPSTSVSLGWGAHHGSDPNITGIVGKMNQGLIYDGALARQDVTKIVTGETLNPTPTPSASTVDDLGDGKDFARLDQDWSDANRPRDWIDDIEVLVANRTCADGSGLKVTLIPDFTVVGSNFITFVDWYEDETHVKREVWSGLGGSPQFAYSDTSTGSDAGDATEHVIRARIILMDDAGSDPVARDSKSASVRATYGFSC